MKFLILGDVVGRPGREAVTNALPELRDEHNPDGVIINIENIAHGNGVSPETFREAEKWEACVYTTGDHAWDNEKGMAVLEDDRVIRPINYPDGVPGRGYTVTQFGAFRVAVINLQGQVFFRNSPINPFLEIEKILKIPDIAEAEIKLIDFHAEATSEARGMGWHLDGKISAIWGTHTHVPTADEQILPDGTGYITDLGMCGGYESIIGADREGPLRQFRTQLKTRRSFDHVGPGEVNGIAIEVSPSTGKTEKIERVRKIVG